jgi:long-chain-alcohol oxidase
MREEILISWADSPFESRRKLYKGFTSIGLLTAYVHSDVACEAVGYPSSGDPNRFLSRPPPATPRHEHVFAAPSPQVTTDFLVIGSGSGGGVAAAEFSKTGQKVLVVEQGTFFPLGELEGTQAAGLNKLFLNGGCQTSEDGSISVLAGATFGGGSFSKLLLR